MFFMRERLSWNDQLAFLAVLEEGSLSSAARRLGVSHATVRSRVEALEAALGTVLFTRSVNGLVPTDSALALHEPARTMAMASAQFVRLATASPGEVAGVVRISVPDVMGTEVVPPMLAAIRDKHPAIRIELSLSNAQADVLAHEVDIAVRTVAPAQGALVARKVASIPLGWFASTAYLEKRGAPASMAELAGHDLIGPDRDPRDLALARQLGLDFTPENLAVKTDSHPAQLAAARAGLGIAAMQVPVGQRDPRLRRVLPDVTLMHMGVWIVTHEDLRHVPKVRVVLDGLSSAFSGMDA